MTKKIATMIQAMFLVMFVQGCWANDTGDIAQKNTVLPDSVNTENSTSASPPSNAPISSGNELMSKWLGEYDPVSRDGVRMNQILMIKESSFSWMSCKEVGIQPIAISQTAFSFEVDPNAGCSWAGWIVEMSISGTPSKDETLYKVTAYRDMNEYQDKEYAASYPYSKISK